MFPPLSVMSRRSPSCACSGDCQCAGDARLQADHCIATSQASPPDPTPSAWLAALPGRAAAVSFLRVIAAVARSVKPSILTHQRTPTSGPTRRWSRWRCSSSSCRVSGQCGPAWQRRSVAGSRQKTLPSNCRRSGVVNSAAADGVGALGGRPRRPLSCGRSRGPHPIPPVRLLPNMARATSSALKHQRSSSDPPPRATMITSANPSSFSSCRIALGDLAAGGISLHRCGRQT